MKSVEEQQFLDAIALQLNLTGDTLATFLARFNRKNADRENVTLVSIIRWNKEPEDASQKLQDELGKICKILEDNGGPSNKPKRGRAAKGQSPWQQGYKWLWESRFPEWQRQNNQPLSLPGEICRKGQANIDALVQEVRSRLHDRIQRLHGTMPLWGVDGWVPLGELFVDVNILEKLSSSRMSELDDLWQDFSKNPSYRSLDRIGLGRERQRVSGLEVVAKNTNLMVVGKPGSGKTTYLQRVVTECNAGKLQAHRIPVLIRLRDFVKDGGEVAYPLKPYLEKSWQLSDAESLLKQGRVLVLLDGLDEVTGEDGKKITEEIKKFARDYPQVQVIVTCRTQSQESRFERFDYVEVADFNEGQVRSFSEHWFKTVMRDESAGLARAGKFLDQLFLESHKPIRDLAITPILLSLTCAVFHETGKFYSKRSKLYKKGLELLLEKWNKPREIERDEIYGDLSVEQKLKLLSYLAVKKFEQTQYVLFEQTEIEGYITEFLKGQGDSRAVLRGMEAQHGLLIERSQKVWSFSHLTFQEYLVTRQILANCNPLSINDPILNKLVSHVIDKRWQEVFLLATTMLNKPDVLFSLIKAIIDKLFLRYPPLQSFLIGVNEKSKSVDTAYKSAAVRVLYFNNCRLGFSHKIDNSIPSHFKKIPYLYLNLKDEISIDYHLKLALDLSYDIARHIQQDPEGELEAHQCLYYSSSSACVFSVVLVLRSGLKTYPQRGENMIKELSQVCKYHPHQGKEYKQWWQTNGKGWTEKLKLFMTEYRNIEHDWQFSEEQHKLLQQYNDANELLVDCLNSGCSISQKVKQEIEEMLLLPIAEIEKRKCEKTD